MQLVTGETVVGDVTLEGDDGVVVEVRYPAAKTLKLRRDDLAPESLFAVVERKTDPKDPVARRSLGELAERLGLLAAAAAEYAAVGALDPTAAKDMEGRITSLSETVAADLLEDAKALLEDGKPAAALLYLHTVLERYPRTPAAKEAQGLMAAAHKAAGASAEVSEKTVDPQAAGKLADAIEAQLAKGDAARQGVSGHPGAGGTSDVRALDRAIDRYESAWEKAKDLPVAGTGDAALDGRIASLKARAKASLVRAYLDAGTALLQRRAIPGAEKYCNRACELDPENRENHELHRLIVLAKASYGQVGGRGGR